MDGELVEQVCVRPLSVGSCVELYLEITNKETILIKLFDVVWWGYRATCIVTLYILNRIMGLATLTIKLGMYPG